MAQIVVRLFQLDVKFMSRSCVYLSRVTQSGHIYRCLSSDSPAEGEKDSNVVENEEETDAARDISRMPKLYRDRMKHVLNPPEKPDWYAEMFQKIDQKRKLYGKYGRKSGLDPGILWPSKEEVKEQIEFEKEWEPSLDEMLKSLEEERALEERKRQLKRQTVDKQMSRMPQFIKEYHGRLEKVAQKEREQEDKKRELLEEARDYFGYSIDPRDPRFEEMQLRKEEEEKKIKKKKKKELKALREAQGLPTR